MGKYVSIRVETNSTYRTGKEKAHAERMGKTPNYVDQSRTHLNSNILPWSSSAELKKECLALRLNKFENDPNAKNKPTKIRKDGAVSLSGIITFSTEAQPIFGKLTHEEQDRKFLKSAEIIAERFNTELKGLTVHRDESAIHAHFQIPAYDMEGNPLTKKLKKGFLSELQDLGALPFNDLEITRGKKIGQRIAEGDNYSKTINRSVAELHADLPREIEAAKAKVKLQEERENKANQKLADLKAEISAGTSNKAKIELDIKKLEKRAITYQYLRQF